MTEQLGMIHRFVKGTTPDTLLLLHGTGGDEDDLLALGRRPRRRRQPAEPPGTVLENGMPRFFRRLALGSFRPRRTWPHGPTSWRDSSEEAASALRARLLARITAVGYSNGANIAASLLLPRPGLLRCGRPAARDAALRAGGCPSICPARVCCSPPAGTIPSEPSTRRTTGELLKQAGAEVTLAVAARGP